MASRPPRIEFGGTTLGLELIPRGAAPGVVFGCMCLRRPRGQSHTRGWAITLCSCLSVCAILCDLVVAQSVVETKRARSLTRKFP